MKANEAPEKIYLDDSMSTDTAGELWSDALWFDTKVSDDSIEYTRTDAFIDKASEWLSKHAIKYYLDGSKFLGTHELVEDFKIAMTL